MSEVSSSSLKRLKDTFKPSKGKIIPPVQRLLLKRSNESDRDVLHVHPSEMAKDGWCPRSTWLRITGAEPNPSSSNRSSKMEMVFHEGHAIHAKWQEWIGSAEGLDLYGKWKCRQTGHTSFGWGGDLQQDGDWVYMELPFNPTREMLVMGHTDGLVGAFGEEEGLLSLFLVEVKSVGIGTLRFEAPKLYWDYTNGELDVGTLWMNIKRPFPSHMRQGLLYLYLLQNFYPEFSHVDEIVFLYEYKPTQDVREFSVKLNETTLAFIQPLLDSLDTITVAVREGTEVPRPEWAKTKEGPICDSCEFSSACWGVADDTEPAPTPEPRRRRVSKSSSAKRRRAIG